MTLPEAHAQQLSARRWLLDSARELLGWRETRAAKRLQAFAGALAEFVAIRPDTPTEAVDELARQLPDVLRSCDNLSFDYPAQAHVYASLHLVDRYARVSRVLERLVSRGLLPLRRSGVRALEVGAGPAPALYSIRDFYADLVAWPGRGSFSLSPVIRSDSVERGKAWSPFMHHFSELLMVKGARIEEGILPFQTAHDDLRGLNVQLAHSRELESRASQIVAEAEWEDGYISPADARLMVHHQGVQQSSAYDLIVMCNFLTQSSMTAAFATELRSLAQSLTPGGVLLVLGSTAKKYDAIYKDVQTLAANGGLTKDQPVDFDAGKSSAAPIVCSQMRSSVASILEASSAGVRTSVSAKLPRDLLDSTAECRFPKYRVLTFVCRRSSNRAIRRR